MSQGDLPETAIDREFKRNSVWSRAAFGAFMGLMLPGALTIFIMFGYLSEGRYGKSGRTVTDNLLLLIIFPLGSILFGALRELMAPWATDSIRSTAIATLAVAPLVFGSVFCLNGARHNFTSSDLLISLAISVVVAAFFSRGALREKQALLASEETSRGST